MTKQMTYTQALEVAISVMEEGEAKDRVIALKASLEKKSEKKKSAVDNSPYFEAVLDALASGDKTPTELVAVIGVANTQKVASIVKPLIANGTVVKEQKGKKVTYSLA